VWAIKLLGGSSYDGIILDIGLLHMNGLEVLSPHRGHNMLNFDMCRAFIIAIKQRG
jgi:DNA-binding response OmpR family regulator